MSRRCLVIVACLVFSCKITPSFSNPHENVIKWVSAENVLLLKMDPAGFQNGTDVFLCRVAIGDNVVPGKLIISEGSLNCSVAHRGSEYQDKHFEILYSHPGTISWRKYFQDEIQNAIPGGTYDGLITYPCRAVYNGNVIPGAFDSEKETCNIALDGNEHNRGVDLEILTKNGFGYAMNTKIETTYLSRSSVCENIQSMPLLELN